MRISDWSSDVCSSDLRAQEALLIALTEWPESGVPDKPGAWLTAAAKRRLIDGVRHDAMRTRKEAEIARELDEEQDMRVEAAPIGRASGRERVCASGSLSGVADSLKTKTQ